VYDFWSNSMRGFVVKFVFRQSHRATAEVAATSVVSLRFGALALAYSAVQSCFTEPNLFDDP
jgi:hypothetical protein